MLSTYLLLSILSRLLYAEFIVNEDLKKPDDTKLARMPRRRPRNVDDGIDFGEIMMNAPFERSDPVHAVNLFRKPTTNRWAPPPAQAATFQVQSRGNPRRAKDESSSTTFTPPLDPFSSSESEVVCHNPRQPRQEVRPACSESSSTSGSHHQFCRPIICSESSSAENICQPCRRKRSCPSSSYSSSTSSSRSCSSSLSSSSSDVKGCELSCGCEDINYIESMDFYHTYPKLEGPGKTWSYLTFLDYTADGGNLMTGCKGGFLDTREYYNGRGRNPFPELDHLKYYIYANDLAPVPRRGSLVIEWKASVETFKTCRNPFGEKVTLPFDPRLGCGGFIAYDPTLGLSFNFLLTSDRVYVMYSRDPYQRVNLAKAYASFAYIFPVKKRTGSEVNRLRVVFDDEKKEVRWYVDYRLVYRLKRVGNKLDSPQYMTLDYSGNDDLVFPGAIQYGFGSFTFLDHYPVCYKDDCSNQCQFPTSRMGLVRLGDEIALTQFNPLLGFPHEASYFDDYGKPENRLWGQGSETRVFKLSVYQSFKDCKKDSDMKLALREADEEVQVEKADNSQFLMLADE